MRPDEQIVGLWKLLDDIDTLDDACKGDDRLFRYSVRRVQRKRFDIVSGGEFDALASSPVTPPQPEAVEGEGMETEGYLFRLRYGPDRWSDQLMFSSTLPRAEDHKETRALVDRSDAERLLSQKDAEIERLANALATAIQMGNTSCNTAFEQIARAEAAEARIAELEGTLCRDLNVTDEELVRIRNSGVGRENVLIWTKMLMKIVDAVRRARALLSPETKP